MRFCSVTMFHQLTLVVCFSVTTPGHTLHESAENFYSKTTFMSYHGLIDRQIYPQSNTSGWDILGRRVRQRKPPPQTLQDLFLASHPNAPLKIMLDNHGHFITYAIFCRSYQLNLNDLQYYGLINVIPNILLIISQILKKFKCNEIEKIGESIKVIVYAIY